MIEDYFVELRKIINSYEIIKRAEINTNKINDEIGVVEGKLSFDNGILDFIEVIRITGSTRIEKKKYKYHFRFLDNQMVFRYDNMPHHPKVDTFPHHKHVGDNVLKSFEVDILHVLREIQELNTI